MPNCPICNGEMGIRTKKSDGSKFYGCKKYPDCKGIVNIEKPTPPVTQNTLNYKEDKRLELLKKAADLTIAQLDKNPDISILSALEINLRHLIEVYKGKPTVQKEVNWEEPT